MRRRVRSLGVMLLLASAALFGGAGREASPVPPMFPSGRPEAVFLANLPDGVSVDSFGNVWVTRGSGRPHVLVLTHRDMPGYVVSKITPDGFLRLQRLGVRATLLVDQFMVGRRVLIYTKDRVLPGVVACPSTHFRRGGDVPIPEATVDDLWVDIGAESASEAGEMGVSLLDPVVPPSTGDLRGFGSEVRVTSDFVGWIADRTNNRGGSVTFAWVAGGTEGGRGSRRLLSSLGPVDSVFVFEPFVPDGSDSLARRATLAADPVLGLAPGDSSHAPSRAWALRLVASRGAGIALEAAIPSPDARVWTGAGIPTVVVGLPTAFPGSEEDMTRLANRFIALVSSPLFAERGQAEIRYRIDGVPGVESPKIPTFESAGMPGPTGRDPHLASWTVLKPLLQAYGVSEHESHVADAIRAALPADAAAAAKLDSRGNLVLRLGDGPPARLFVAHQDEIGYRITSVDEDGRGRVEKEGGFYDWLYETERVRVEGGSQVAEATVSPRVGFRNAPRPVVSHPMADELRPPAARESRFDLADVRIDPWTLDARTNPLRPGQDVTVLHEIARLGVHRLSARAIDDRYGCASLVMAAKELWPRRKSLPNTVWLVWSVEEEIGLKGAEWLADSLLKAGALPKRVHAVDTFVSSDSPLEDQRYGDAKLGHGAVVRAVDTSHEAPIEAVRATLALAKREGIPLQYGVTSGGNDGVPFAERGSINVPLAWPLRYSHSAVEVADLRDLESLARLVIVLSRARATDDPNRP